MPDLPLLALRARLLADRAGRSLHDLVDRLRTEERGGPMTEYAVLLGVAAVAIGLIAAVIAFVRSKFAAFGG